MDQYIRSVKRAQATAGSLEVPAEEITRWLAQPQAVVALEPGLTSYPRGGPAMERYVRFRRDQAFVEAYFAEADEHATMWHIVPTGVPADPAGGTHNLSTLFAADLRPAHQPALGDIALIELGRFVGYEREVQPLLGELSQSGTMLYLPQLNVVDGRAAPAWFWDSFEYVSAVPDGDLYLPYHPELDSQ